MTAKAGNRVFVSAHVSEVYGPVQALKNYLEEKGFAFTILTHPFPYTKIEGSLEEAWEEGKRLRTRMLQRRISLGPLQFALNFLTTLRSGWHAGQAGLFVGIGNLNALAGLVLKWLGRVDRVAYYVIDHTPGRFGNPLMNAVYGLVDRICCRGCDVLWCLSYRIAEAKQARGAAKEKCIDCPVGVKLEELKFPPASKRRRHVLVVMSHLTKEKGVQLVLESFAEIRRRHKKAVLEVIGTGPYEGELKMLAAGLKLGSAVRFLGLMNHQQLFRHLPGCGISLATYTEDEDNIAYYADPTKPKEYLACGLPMIITKVPWTWEKVADKRAPMGVAINYRKEELVEAADKLLGDRKFYARCRKNALAWTRTLAWEKIFDRVLA